MDFYQKTKRNVKKKDGVMSEWWIYFAKKKRELLRKKMEFGANNRFEKKKTFSGLSESLPRFTISCM